MFHLRYHVYALLLVAVQIMVSCSWSATQQEVLDAYNEAAGYIDRHEWESAVTSMSSSTMFFLDSLASDLETRGLQTYGSGADLLPVLCWEYVDLSGDVTMIFNQGDRAEVTVISAETRKYSMILEDGRWNLDLEVIFRNRIDTALKGSYVY